MRNNVTTGILLISMLFLGNYRCIADEGAVSDKIINDSRWLDDRGIEILANKGGHITKIGDIFYWVGNDADGKKGNDIHLYSSKTLGSKSWKYEGKLWDFPDGGFNGNCTILYCRKTQKYVIVSKGLHFFESSKVTGPYKLVRNLKQSNTDRKGWGFGGLSVYQEGHRAYLVVSRHFKSKKVEPEVKTGNQRYVGIYALTPEFTNIERELYWGEFTHREAPWIFKKGSKYYMTFSHTKGWKPSKSYFKTANNLSGPWSTERRVVGMRPKSNISHKSQHRYIKQIGNQWLYGGDRYPVEAPSIYDERQGRHIMCPVTWEGETPVVQWKDSWTIHIP